MENSSPEIQQFKNQVEALQEQISDSDLDLQEKSNEALRATLTALTDTIEEDILTFSRQKQLNEDEKTVLGTLNLQLREIRYLLTTSDEKIQKILTLFSSGLSSKEKDNKIELSRREALALAADPNTPPEVFAILAKDEDPDVKFAIINAPHMPPEILEMLANDKNPWVRKVVALTTNTPPEILAILAKDEDPRVRIEVASNHNTPPEAFKTLAEDEDQEVAIKVASNNHIPPELFAILAKSTQRVRIALVSNDHIPPEILAVLAKDEDPYIRSLVKLIKRHRNN